MGVYLPSSARGIQHYCAYRSDGVVLQPACVAEEGEQSLDDGAFQNDAGWITGSSMKSVCGDPLYSPIREAKLVGDLSQEGLSDEMGAA